MSATLRYDIGRSARNLLEFHRPGIMDKVGGKRVSRWPGWKANHRRECFTFGLKLPRDLEATWNLYRVASESQVLYNDYLIIESLRFSSVDFSLPVARLGCEVLAAKLCRSLGVPGYVAKAEEGAFVVRINAEPTDQTTWSVYADWLMEQDSEDCVTRGQVILGWLGKRAVKMKYGVPVYPRNVEEIMDYQLLSSRDYIGETVRAMAWLPAR